MTVLELFEIIATRVKDPTENIITAINAVSDRLMKRAGILRLSLALASSAVNTVAAQEDILLPTDYQLLAGNPMIGTLELHVMPLNGETIYTQQTRPSFYRLEAARMVLAPTPDAVYSIILNYYAKAEKVVELDDDLPFAGRMDEAFPELTALVMTMGRAGLLTAAGEALIQAALEPWVLAEEQNLADSINNQTYQ